MRLARHYDGFEMTHIEAKAANISLGGPSEPSSEAEAALSPEALVLFSSLFVQMQPEMEGDARLWLPWFVGYKHRNAAKSLLVRKTVTPLPLIDMNLTELCLPAADCWH